MLWHIIFSDSILFDILSYTPTYMRINLIKQWRTMPLEIYLIKSVSSKQKKINKIENIEERVPTLENYLCFRAEIKYK